MAELPDRLKAAVGDTYRIDKELGGGGMSRVFLAEEIELGRRVVIKVLPPEMAAEVNKERFHREIQLAAKLQHPHVVSLLTAGSEDDLLYYVMPYIEGESLRTKLAREGELPIAEATRLLKEVVDALAYAHRNGVVHRDIKPDNVLLTEGHAVVTDFGVAKAVTASSGASSLTSLGVALGTPAYMAPEQAAADPHTDHRADIYAVGALAYEMLCGQPPFTGATPQEVMAAHVSKVAEPLSTRRSAVSEALNATVMRCLEKRAADRWQSAAELIPQLEAATTPSGGVTPTGIQPVASVSAERAARHAHPVRVVGLFGLASVGALATVYVLMQALGLPDWVFAGAIILLATGLPIILVTGHQERRRALARTTGVTIPTPSSGIRRWFTWRMAISGGVLAFTGFGLATAIYMAMRLLGMGPVGTLVAAGVIEERAPIVLADFVDYTGDSSLARALTEAFRVDLAQSKVVTLMSLGELSSALERMRADPAAPLDPAMAREVAVREGVPAVVTGEINAAGRGFVLSTQLVEVNGGEILAAFRETADDDSQVISAIDRLSRRLRERIGESFNTMRAQEPLDRVTTVSLEALRSYSAGLRAELAGDAERAIGLFEEAIELDTTFAMAYRKLSVVLFNTGGVRSRFMWPARRAFAYRDRLPELERYQLNMYYYALVEVDRERAIAIGLSGLERYPDDPTLLTTVAYVLNQLRRYEEAEPLARRGRAYGNSAWNNEIMAQIGKGGFARAESTVVEFEALYPDQWLQHVWRSLIASRQHDFATAERELDSASTFPNLDRPARSFQLTIQNRIALARGRLATAEQHIHNYVQVSEERDMPGNALTGLTRLGLIELLYRGRTPQALQTVEEALERHPLDGMDPLDRPYARLAEFYAAAGQVDRARQLLEEYESLVDESIRSGNSQRHDAAGAIALAEDRPVDAIAAFRARYEEGSFQYCGSCGLYRLGQAYEASGEVDSAIAVWERALATSHPGSIVTEAWFLAATYRRLGEIYEERGDTEKAAHYYNEFVELWRDADEELQPQVEDVRERIARLVGER